MALPEDFTELPYGVAAAYVAVEIEENGICWLGIGNGDHADSIMERVIERFPDLSMLSEKPDYDHVIIDLDKFPEHRSWIEGHAQLRYEMKERGIPEHMLPPLPEGVRPEEPDEDDED
jgi:hypothetical protein